MLQYCRNMSDFVLYGQLDPGSNVLLEATCFKEISLYTNYSYWHTNHNCLEVNLFPAEITYPIGYASVIGALLIETPDVSLDVTNKLLLVWKIRFPYQRTITKHPHARSLATSVKRFLFPLRRRWRSRRAPIRTLSNFSSHELVFQCRAIICRGIHSEIMLHVTSSASVIATQI